MVAEIFYPAGIVGHVTQGKPSGTLSVQVLHDKSHAIQTPRYLNSFAAHAANNLRLNYSYISSINPKHNKSNKNKMLNKNLMFISL